MKKRILSFLLAFVMVLGMIPANLFGMHVSAAALDGNEIPVTDNVIDITDKQIYKLTSKYQVTATNITVSGADVVAAAENGTTVHVLLDGTTALDAAVSVEFGYSGNKCALTDHTGTVTLENGEGTLNLKVKGYYTSMTSQSSTVNYTIHFTVDVLPTEVPTRLQETDSVSTYNGVAVELDISDYFKNGATYYLVEGDTKTVLEGKKYTFCTSEGGTHTLVFGAGNTVGDCPEYVTVTVEVTEIKSGIWVGQTSSNGSWDYVVFKDADGNEIEGLTVALDGKTIQVYLPKNYDPSGKVIADFSLTQTDGLPVLTTSKETAGTTSSQWSGKKFTQKTFTLSGGAASLSFYYCNQSPRNESPVTWNLNIQMLNDLPTLAEGVSATKEATITAGQTYGVALDSIFADVDGDALTYQVSVNGVAEAAAADYTFSTTTAGTYTLVFTANDGKGTSTDTYTVTLTVENASDTYSMTAEVPADLEPAFYVCSGYDATGTDLLGETVEAIAGETAEGMTTYTLKYPTNADAISVRADGWGGMAFTAEENATVSLRQANVAAVDYDNNPAESTNKATYGEHTAVGGENGWLLVAGTEYTFTATPANADLKTTSQKVTLEIGAEIYTVQILLDISNPVAITVPTGAKAQLYKYKNYYNNEEQDAKIIRDNGDGTTTFYFVADTKNGTWIYRVSMEGKITKSGWVAWGKNNMNFTYTDQDKSPSYRLDDYTGTGQANSTLTEDSVLLNINSRNHLSLSVGDSKVLKAYRAWEIIPISYNNHILTPDFHFNILSGSDVVSLTPKASASTADGDWMTLTALKEGVAIIEVTYDAMEVSGGSYDGTYGASDPARTGFVVVQVGGSNDTSVNFGIDGFASIGTKGPNNTTYNPNKALNWDAEFDTLYFTENSGQINLKPTASSTIQEVAVSNDKGVSWTVLNGTDGTYTATIVPGNNIIRVTTGAGVAYQVVRGDKLTVTVTEVADKSDSDGEIEVGETIRVTLKGLHAPIPKMSGLYNPGYGGNSDGFSSYHLNYSLDGEAVYGKGTQYTFITEANYVDVVVPESGVVELTDGYIGVGVIGETAFYVDGNKSHRNIPDDGLPGGNSATQWHTRSVLPEITITAVDADTTVPVTEVQLDKTTADMEVGDSLTLTATILPENATVQEAIWSTSDETIATVNDGVVTAVAEGEVTITATAGECTATCVITITKPAPIPATGVSLNVSEAKVEVGKTLTLAAAVTPSNTTDKTITWTSSNENVATVNNGIVAAISAGETVITASIGDFQATCKVTVERVEDTDKIATVYFSYSHDAEFIKPQNGSVAALQKLDVPCFDLALYGLEQYKMAENDRPTMLHLYIYATEVLYYGLDATEAGKGYLYNQELIGSNVFAVSGGAGSLCMDKFWGYDMNLNYYHNYVFPRYSDGEGATADRIVLADGDVVTVGHFTSWDFYSDPSSIFNYLVANGKTVALSAMQESELTLNVYRAGADMGLGDGSNSPVKRELDVYYAKAEALTSGKVSDWTKLGTTDGNGQLKIEKLDLEAGRYVLAVAGQKGVQATTTIVSTPGGIVLEVLESAAGNAVQAVIDKITAIGTVTLDSKAAIQDARSAYDALTEEQKAAVDNYALLTTAEAELARLENEKADQDAADAVVDKINAIGTVTLDSKTAIDEARAAYDALTEQQKALVSETILKKLTDAEKAYADLIADQADKNAAKAVEDQIAAIGTVSLHSEDTIVAARQAYEALTDTQKQLVGNYEILTAAEKKLAELKDEAAANAVEEMLNAIGTVTLDSEEKITAARAAYEALTDAQKALVENLSVLEAAEEALELLKLGGTDITDIYKTTGDYLAGLSAPAFGTINGEWRVIGLSRAGKTVTDSYYHAVVNYVKENIDKDGRLHASKSTDNSRLIVALTAIGKDVTNVAGYDLLAGLDDMDYIGNQGINGTIWALIAFDSHDYEIPAGNVTRKKLVAEILDAQLLGGGWALAGTVGDPDMTGMALQALAPYYNTNSDVKKSVDKALTWLGGIQNKDGTFTGMEGTTSESLAQVITGLTALGINPETDARFIKNGVSAVDALSKFYVTGGGFKHGLTGDRNMMATEQAYYALVSYYRLLQGKTSLYDMSDVTIVIPTYQIIDGADSDWQKGDTGLTIRANGEFSKFTGVKVDGVVVDSKHYTAKEGSTIVTFKTEYLKTLSEGDHTITVSFTDGEASTTVTIMPSDEDAAKHVMDLIAAIGTVTESSGEKIKAARNAYDALTAAQKALVTNYKTLTDAESAYDALVSKISVSFTLLGCSKHGEGMVHTLAGGNLSTWIATKTYKMESGATVKDVLEKALKEAGMSWKNPTGNYVESINGIGEFTNGSNSGWMYTLNGVHPNLGVAQQSVKEGDVIVFHYTDDYTKEASSQGFADRDEAAAETVEKLIDAIGTVTLNSKDKIEAARKAYDALTYTQKQKVENYKKLTDAEAKFAELKKADDEEKAKAVEVLIDKIDEEITLDSETEITAARKAYDALTADQKKLVGNYKKLTDAEYDLALLKADAQDKEAAEKVEKLIDAIGVVTSDSEQKIKAARDAYDNLTDLQKALVKNYADLEAAEAKLAMLKALADVEEIYKTTGDYLENLGTPVPGSVGGEWMVIGLIRSGRELQDADGYYDAVIKFVQENIDENGRLHNAKSTENSRVILALTAMGKDVTNVDGHNLLTGLDNMEYVQKQGINGPIWALMALDSGNYPAPDGDVTREALIQVILNAQLADGGWALTGTVSDPDITGMALQALAPYYKTNAQVKKAVDEAVETLSMMQAADGSFASIDGSSSESVAQVVAALSALGIDANTDSRFIKNGISALDALCTFFVKGGGFKHVPDGKLDGMATEQSYYALVAYFRMLEGKTNLFDMTDVVNMGGDPVEEEPAETLPVETEPVPAEPVEPPAKVSRSFPWWLVIVIVVLAGGIVVLVVVSKSKKHKYVR